MTDEKKSATELAREARTLAAQAKAAAAVETEAANDPDRAQRWKDAVADAERPERRDAVAREAFQRSPVYKAAREHVREQLGEVREALVQMRTAGVDELEADARADLIKRIGAGVPERMSEQIRKAGEAMLDRFAQTGDLNAVDEAFREGVIGAANKAPYSFVRPESRDESLADVLAAIPRMNS